jgi:hypothetical protein
MKQLRNKPVKDRRMATISESIACGSSCGLVVACVGLGHAIAILCAVTVSFGIYIAPNPNDHPSFPP